MPTAVIPTVPAFSLQQSLMYMNILSLTFASDLLGHLALVAGLAADYLTTRWAIRHGAVEANPFLDNPGPRAMVGILVGHGVVVESLSLAAAAHAHPGIASGFRIINGGIHFGAAISNVRVALNQIRKGH